MSYFLPPDTLILAQEVNLLEKLFRAGNLPKQAKKIFRFIKQRSVKVLDVGTILPRK